MKIKAILFFCLITVSAMAQMSPYGAPPPPPSSYEANMPDEWGARYFHFGLNFTPGIYWTSPTTSNNTSNGTSFGYGYGANLEFYFTRNYGFLMGFEVQNIGAKYINTNSNPSQTTLDSTVTHNETVQYLQIPFELKLKTSPFGKFRFYGVVGLDFGFRLKATDDYSSVINLAPVRGFYYNSSYSANNVNISDQTDFFRVSLVIGLGAEYELAGSTALQASITYNNCFTNLNNTSSSGVNVKGIELMLGLLF
ncbi:MAG TPA: porin family protein [Bacteroidia bacterium]|jgi:hypothetical protein|nr:porin family protein [Bacteroidia bacterium]